MHLLKQVSRINLILPFMVILSMGILSPVVSGAAELYQTTFVPSHPIMGPLEIVNLKHKSELVFVQYTISGNRQIAVPYEAKGSKIRLNYSGHDEILTLTLIFGGEIKDFNTHLPEIISGKDRINGQWDDLISLSSGAIIQVTNTLESSVAGDTTSHMIGFNTTTDTLSSGGIIMVTYPPGFIIDAIDSAIYSDNDPSNDSNEPHVTAVSVTGGTVFIQLDSLSQQAIATSRIDINLKHIVNDTTSGSRYVYVQTTRPDGEIDNNPQISAPFDIVPGALYRINVSPSGNLTLASDSTIYFSGIGRDSYGNIIGGLVFDYLVMPDSHGSITSGIFRALKAGECYVTLTNGIVTDSTGLITVEPGRLNHFGIDGLPLTPVPAGVPFGSVMVTALDNHDNRIVNFADSVWVTSNDTLASLPIHKFDPADSGIFQFPANSFSLRSKGSTRITFSNGIIESISNPVTVVPTSIQTFVFGLGLNQVAGNSFRLQVTEARDSCSNLTNGIVVVGDSLEPHFSPNGFPPIFNEIPVSEEGVGYAMQTLTNADTTVLKGSVFASGAVIYTSRIIVEPGSTDYFGITDYPDTVTAGIPFSGVMVSVFDLFGNLQTNFADQVYFTSNDGNALLPFTASNRFTWLSNNGGRHTFDNFSLRTSGIKTITFANDSLSITSQNIAVRPAPISTYTLVNPGTIMAGVSHELRVENARDSLANFATGEVNISGLLNVDNSPYGIAPTLNRISVDSFGTGHSSQILTSANSNVILQGDANGIIENTGSFIVLPGDLDHYDISGFTDTLTAGNTFPGPGINVEVLDALGNRKTNYIDSVYFVSSDPQPQLPNTQSSKYYFNNSGYNRFPADSFSLRTSGAQTISVTNGTMSASSQNISVAPSILNSFRIADPGTITSGVPFSINILDAIDTWNNPTLGTITVSTYSGGGPSPDGTLPNFTPIQLNNGSGSASQTLYNADSTVLSLSTGVFDSLTANLAVLPGSVSHFTVFIYSPQISGAPFSVSAYLTAYDSHGNIKRNYDASSDTVVITASNGGQMTNNILNQNASFFNGTANLVALNTTYSGAGGPVTFNALSQSGATGTSNPVNFSALYCSGLTINETAVSIGGTMTGSVSVRNEGGVVAKIDDIGLYSVGDPWQDALVFIQPLDSIAAGAESTYTFSYIIPLGFSPSHVNIDIPTTATIIGRYGSYSVYDTLTGYPDTVQVQTNSHPGYVNGSLSRDTLSTGEYYSLSLSLSNSGGAGLGVLDSSYIYFSDISSHIFRSKISTGIFLPPNSLNTPVNFDSTLVVASFIPGDYQAAIHCFGRENGIFVVDTIAVADIIHIQSRAVLSYLENTLNPDTLVAGQNAMLSVRVRNSGTSEFILDNQFSRIHFGNAQMEFIANIDTSAGRRIDIITSDTTLHFEQTILSPNFSLGQFTPEIAIRGSQNGRQIEFNIDTNPNSINVISPCAVRIDSTYSISPNAPFVNEGQQCSIRVVIENTGMEGIDSVTINLLQFPRATFQSSFLIEHLDGDSSMVSRTFTGVADSVPNSGRIFNSILSGGVGSRSRMIGFDCSTIG